MTEKHEVRIPIIAAEVGALGQPCATVSSSMNERNTDSHIRVLCNNVMYEQLNVENFHAE